MQNAIAQYRSRHKLTLQAFGEKVGVGAPTICKWERGRVPAERVLDVERLTGISRHDLRPDLFGADPSSPAPLPSDAPPPASEGDASSHMETTP